MPFRRLAGLPWKTLNFATQYVAALPTWMPSEARAGYSNVLPFIEMAIGALLILGLTTRVGGMRHPSDRHQAQAAERNTLEHRMSSQRWTAVDRRQW